MKKHFIIPFIACILAISNVKAQNTPIDDFLKKYPSREGVTNVTLSQQMLQDLFAPPKTSDAQSRENTFFTNPNQNVPEAYSSVSVSKTGNTLDIFADFKKILISSKYEQYMEENRENKDILCYFLKKGNKNTNEIMVLRQQKEQFSAVYIKGNIGINDVQSYLYKIKVNLEIKRNLSLDMFPSERQFAFTIPSFENFKLPNLKEFNFKTDSIFNFKMDENLRLRLEESMKEMKKKMKDMYENGDLQRKIEDAMENVQKQFEDAKQKQLMEEK